MKYFCTKNELDGTGYHEFFAGQWDDRFWNEDSLYIDDQMFRDCGLRKALKNVIPDYSPYDTTEVFPDEWDQVKGECEAASEADDWVQAAFAEHGMFTILGI